MAPLVRDMLSSPESQMPGTSNHHFRARMVGGEGNYQHRLFVVAIYTIAIREMRSIISPFAFEMNPGLICLFVYPMPSTICAPLPEGHVHAANAKLESATKEAANHLLIENIGKIPSAIVDDEVV